MFKEHPILGGGEHNSGTLVTSYNFELGAMTSSRKGQHSLYLKYLGEQGLVGGILLVIIIANFVISRLHLAQLEGWPAPTVFVGQGAWVLGIIGLARGVVGGGSVLFFMGTAFLVAALDTGKKQAQQARRTRHAGSGA